MGENSGGILKHSWRDSACFEMFKIWVEDFFKEFLYVRIVQEVPIHQSHGYGRIKIFLTNFIKGHPRNITVKLFQNLTRGIKGFFRKCLKNSSLLPWQPEFWMESNLWTMFKEEFLKEQFCQVWSKLAQRFGRRCLTHYQTTSFKLVQTETVCRRQF